MTPEKDFIEQAMQRLSHVPRAEARMVAQRQYRELALKAQKKARKQHCESDITMYKCIKVKTT